MTRHKLSNECAPTRERDRSAEEFFEEFPKEYQRSRDLIRRLFEALKEAHEQKLTEEGEVDVDAEISVDDHAHACGWREQSLR